MYDGWLISDISGWMNSMDLGGWSRNLPKKYVWDNLSRRERSRSCRIGYHFSHADSLGIASVYSKSRIGYHFRMRALIGNRRRACSRLAQADGRACGIVYVWIRMCACMVLADKGKSGLPGKEAR